MALTPRERLLIAISNGKPDRLPGQVHEWAPYYLHKYLDGCDLFEANERFGLDMAVHANPRMIYSEKALLNWQVEHRDLGTDELGTYSWVDNIKTPSGELCSVGAGNAMTSWLIEPLIKNETDFEIFDKYLPMPSKLDWTPVYRCREKIGDKGIVRSGLWGYGHPGAWQSFCYMMGTENAVCSAVERPDWVRHVEQVYVNKQIAIIEMMAGETVPDLIEIGGETNSSTACDTGLYEQFCLPYDRQQVGALHEAGFTVVCSTCTAAMNCLEKISASGTDGLETTMVTDADNRFDLARIRTQTNNQLFVVGGFDQCEGFENGNPEAVRQMVLNLHSQCPDGGYICAPCDVFFSGDPDNIRAFADALRECMY